MDADAEESPAVVVGTAGYIGSDDDVITAYRAAMIRRSRWYDSWATWLAIVIYGHLFALFGLFAVIQRLVGRGMENGRPVPVSTAVIAGMIGLGAAWVLHARVYAYRRCLKRRVLDPSAVRAPVRYAFTDRGVERESVQGERRFPWRDISEVVGFPDGFLLVHSPTTTEWIPRRAFRPPFDPVAAAAHFRASVPKYAEIGRAAGLARRSPPDPGEARMFATPAPTSPPAVAPVAAPEPSETLGSAVCVFDEPECRAAWTASREFVEAPRRWRKFLLIAGLTIILLLAMAWDAPHPDQKSRIVFLVSLTVMTAIGLRVAWRLGFELRDDRPGWERWLAGFPLRGETVTYRFHPSGVSRDHRSGRSDLSWEMVQQVVESADGFHLVTPAGNEWIPKHALEAPFRPEDLASLLRSKVRAYRRDDRRVGRLLDAPA